MVIESYYHCFLSCFLIILGASLRALLSLYYQRWKPLRRNYLQSVLCESINPILSIWIRLKNITVEILRSREIKFHWVDIRKQNWWKLYLANLHWFANQKNPAICRIFFWSIVIYIKYNLHTSKLRNTWKCTAHFKYRFLCFLL